MPLCLNRTKSHRLITVTPEVACRARVFMHASTKG
ncbi:MAG: hypothetical protein JWO59_542, partial [Chloroflexi bacterium]|nr:hypothetical protein [Chloroflexota bacterium]